jgi:hypothetical protein
VRFVDESDRIRPMNTNPNGQSFIYGAFILRVWCEGEREVWRASLQNAVTGKKIYFATLERLCLFLLSLDDTP